MSSLLEKLEELKANNIGEVMQADWAIDECIELVKQHTDWISVSDELPPEDTTVLVIDCGEVNFGQYSDGLWRAMAYGQYADNCEVKFWQPLPQSPSEVQNG